MEGETVTAYSRGYQFEMRVKKHLESEGWVVFRNGGSHSPADLVAGRAGEWNLIQCQINSYFTPGKKQALKALAGELECGCLLAWRDDKKKLMFEEL